MILYDGMIWIERHPQAQVDHLGFILTFFSPDDSRPAAEQVQAKYISGWHPIKGAGRYELGKNFELTYHSVDGSDPPMPCLWETKLRDEVIRVYNYGITAIFQKDGTFEVSRLD
jgi:hypothetical protein